MKVLTLAQVAEETNLSHRRLLQLIHLGRLKAQRVGNLFVVTPAELERFKALDRPVGRPATRD